MCPWSKLGVFFHHSPLHYLFPFSFLWVCEWYMCSFVCGRAYVGIRRCHLYTLLLCTPSQLALEPWRVSSSYFAIGALRFQMQVLVLGFVWVPGTRISGPHTCTASTFPTDPHPASMQRFFYSEIYGSWTCSFFRQPKFCLYFKSFSPCHTNRHLCSIPNNHPVIKKTSF